MEEYFHFGYEETILFQSWSTVSKGWFAASVVAMFVISVLYEALKTYRDYLHAISNEKLKTDKIIDRAMNSVFSHSKKTRTKMLSMDHLLQTLLYLIQVLISYCLMLVVMTYNTWLCLAVVLGLTLGYFLFGWCQSSSSDKCEHCN